MNMLPKALTGLAAVAFALAIVTAFSGPLFMNIPPHSFGHACTNLALLAIALVLTGDKAGQTKI